MKNKYLYILFTLLITTTIFTTLLILFDRQSQRVYAAEYPHPHLDNSLIRDPYTPTIIITQPAVNDILTKTPQTITINYSCGSTLCLGTAVLDVISLTLDGPTGIFTPVTIVSNTSTGENYTYIWELASEDYVQHILIARARSAGGNLKISEPITTYADTEAPQNNMITITPQYPQGTSFTVTWSATDGSGEIWYDLDYRLDNQTDWTPWITATQASSKTFTVPSQTFVTEGHIYTFRMRSRDKGGNWSDWSYKTTRIGKLNLYLPIIRRNYPPSWKQAEGTANIQFHSPYGCGDGIWYAGTGGDYGVWKSVDNALTWSKVADLKPDAYPVIANPEICDEAYAAVWGAGVQFITSSSAPQAINNNLGEPYVYAVTITNDELYAGTSSKGIYKTGTTEINWQAKNRGITDLRIRSLFAIDGNLYAGSRGCTLHISEDRGENWGVQKILSTDCGDAPVWSIQPIKDTLYAGLGDAKGLYYSNGLIWKRLTAIPEKAILGLAYDSKYGYLYVSAYGSGIYRCKTDTTGVATSCALYNAGLTNNNTYEIDVFNDLLVIGSSNGIWYRPLLP